MTIVNQTSLGLVGVSIYETSSEQRFALGTRIRINYGENKDKSAEVTYVKSLGNRTAGLCYEMPMMSGTDAYQLDTIITTANAATLCGAVGRSVRVCVPCVALSTNEYGWVFVKGVIPILIGANCEAGAKLYTTSTNGMLDDASASSHLLTGVWAITAVGGANATTDCFANQDLHVTQTV